MGYDAFISYSHAADKRLAPALQRGLYRFAAPFPGWRAVSLFRDETNLSASPGLWPTIEKALAASTWFILLASPEAAASPWVAREITWWLEHKGSDRLLIVKTSGRLVWSERDRDFDWSLTTALPTVLQGVFHDEPNITILDETFLSDELDLKHERFRSAVCKLAATIRGRTPESLDGDDVRAWRRLRALATVVVALLIGISVFAWQQLHIVSEQRTLAAARARQTLAGRLAAESRTALPSRPDRALLLAAAAVGLDQSLETARAVYAALAAHPQIDTFLQWEEGPVRGVAMSGDGRFVAIIRDVNEVWVRDAISGASVAVLISGRGDESEAKAYAVALSPDGVLAATGQDGGAVRLWQTASGDQAGDSLEADGSAMALAFDPKGARLAAAGDRGGVRVWDVATRRLLLDLRSPSSSAAASLAFDATGRLLAAWSSNGTLTVWDATTGQPLRPTAVPPEATWHGRWDRTHVLGDAVAAYPGGITVGAVNGDGTRLVTGSGDGWVIAWTTTKRTPLRADVGQLGRAISGLAFSADGQSILAVDEGGMIRWGLRSRKPEDFLWVDRKPGVVHEGRLAGELVRFVSHAGPSLVVATADRTAKLTFQHIAAGPEATLVMSPDGLLGVVIDEERAVLWDLTKERAVTDLRTPAQAGVELAAFSPDSQFLAVGDRDGLVLVWDIAGRRTRTGPFDAHDAEVVRTEFAEIITDRTHVAALAFDARADQLFTASGDGVSRLWDLREGTPTGRLLPLGAGGATADTLTPDVTRAAFAPEGARLAVVVDRRVVLFDVATLRPLVDPLVTGVTEIAFSPDGAWLAVGGHDGSVGLVDVSLDSWVRRACAIANRSLTQEEWQQRGGEGQAPGCSR